MGRTDLELLGSGAIERTGVVVAVVVKIASMQSNLFIRWRRSLFIAIGAALISGNAWAADKPVFLYSRYFNAEGETRYLPDGTYSEVLDRLKEEFEVRVHAEPLTSETLAGVDVVLIANPSAEAVEDNPEPPRFSRRSIRALVRFVGEGGGLILMGNQEDHNLEVETTNRLLRRFGLQFEEKYTDFKPLELPESVPVIGGLKWAYYSGNLVSVNSDHRARPRALVENDLDQPLAQGTRDQAGPLLAVAEPGEGRVVVVTDSGWVTNPVFSGEGIAGMTVEDQDNSEIFRRLAVWAAGER